MNYQRKDLATGSLIGDPAPLPHELVGITDQLLIDLSWAPPVLGFVGQGFFPVAPTLDADKAAKLVAVATQFGGRFLGGFPIVIGGQHETLQMMTADLVNWLVFKGACDDAIAAGQAAVISTIPVRVTSNKDYAVTYQQGHDLMTALRSFGAALMHNNWALKDAVNSATTSAEVEAVDETAGWPTGEYAVV